MLRLLGIVRKAKTGKRILYRILCIAVLECADKYLVYFNESRWHSLPLFLLAIIDNLPFASKFPLYHKKRPPWDTSRFHGEVRGVLLL
jgi:hypothetical protein